MKNTFGNSISLTLFGESHGAYIGAVLDGLAFTARQAPPCRENRYSAA